VAQRRAKDRHSVAGIESPFVGAVGQGWLNVRQSEGTQSDRSFGGVRVIRNVRGLGRFSGSFDSTVADRQNGGVYNQFSPRAVCLGFNFRFRDPTVAKLIMRHENVLNTLRYRLSVVLPTGSLAPKRKNLNTPLARALDDLSVLKH